MSIFGERLKMIREERGMTLLDLAKILETTKSTLSRYENGKIDPNLDSAITIAKALHVSLDWLAGFEDESEIVKYKFGKYTNVIDKCIDHNIGPDKLEKIIDVMKG